MLPPRLGRGAAAVGDFVCVAGGGANLGGAVKSAVNEAYMLSIGTVPI
jgi:hypothetical protein